MKEFLEKLEAQINADFEKHFNEAQKTLSDYKKAAKENPDGNCSN